MLDYVSPVRRPAPSIVSRAVRVSICGLTWGACCGLLASLLLCRLIPAWGVFRLPISVYLGALVGPVVQTRRLLAGRRCGGLRRAALGLIAFSATSAFVATSDTRLRAELEHGMRLPWSAHNIQCRGDALTRFDDRAAITWFEIDHADLAPFLAGLTVTSHGGAWAYTSGSRYRGRTPPPPVWEPHRAELSNPQYTGHVKTWTGQEKPNQALRCWSPVGDFLIVEVLDKPDGGHVIKMYTDWN
ncbi:MAG TPA: hypothetical protein VH475_01810 [Tepidisphaeraceae bacterium]